MEEFEISDALIAIGFAVFVLAVIVPLIAVIVLTVFDILFRQDIGFSRLIWLGMVLFVPVGGLLMYWLLRPKDFNPLLETRQAAYPRHLMYVSVHNGHSPLEAPTPMRSHEATVTAGSAAEGEGPEEKAA